MVEDALIAAVAGSVFFAVQVAMRLVRSDPHAFRTSAAAALAFALAWFIGTDFLAGNGAVVLLIVIAIAIAVLSATSRRWLPHVRWRH